MLQKTHIPLLLTQGLDTHSDPKAIELGKLAILQNGVFDKENRINKRNGLTSKPTSIIGGGSVTNGQGLFNFNNELGLIADNTCYTFDDNSEDWADKGTAYAATIDVKEVFKGPAEEALIVSNLISGNYSITTLFEFINLTIYNRLVIEDISTGAIVYNERIPEVATVGSAGQVFKLIEFNSVVYLACIYDTGSIDQLRLTPFSFSTFTYGTPVEPTLTQTNLNSVIFELLEIDSHLYFGFIDNTGADYGIAKLDNTFAEVAEVSNTQVVFPNVSGIRLAEVPSSTGIGFLFYNTGTANGAYVEVFNQSLVQISSGVFVAMGDGVNSYYNYLLTFPNTTQWTVYASYSATLTPTTSGCTVKRKTVAFASNTVIENVDAAYNFYILSNPFTYNSEEFVIVGLPFANEPALFVLRLSDFHIVARLLYGNTKNYIEQTLWNYSAIATGQYYGPCVKITKIATTGTPNPAPGREDYDAGDFQSLLCSNKITFEQTSGIYNSLSDQLGNNSHLAGGIVQCYDGNGLSELNFLHLPRITAVNVTGAGGSIGAGNYIAYAIYRWYDNKGQAHTSAVSFPFLFNVAGGSSLFTVTFINPYLTNKNIGLNPIQYEIYCTTASGTVPYLVAQGECGTTNTTTTSSVTTISTSATVLYTQGGILDNIAPPSCKSMCVYKNRLVIAGTEDGDVYFSKEWLQGEGVAFAFGFTIPLDKKGGPSTAVGVLDDKLVIFKENSIYITAGEGPLETGAQYDYLRPQELPTNVGCTEPESVVLVPQGLMFKGRKGFYLLSRGLEVIFVGADVEEFNSLRVTGAVKKTDENYVVFTTNSSTALMYNFERGQWGTFTNYEGEDIILWDNKLTLINSSGVVRSENTTFLDDSTYIVMRIVSGWITLAQVLGYYRIYQVIVLGVYKSAHSLKISMGYDYSPDLLDTQTWDATTVIGSDVLPTPYYGTGLYFGDTEKPLWVRKFASQQKNMAFRIAVEDVAPVIGAGEGYSITGFGLLAGVKQGSFKPSASKSIGKV